MVIGSLFIEKTINTAVQNLQSLQGNFGDSVIQNISNFEKEIVEEGKMGFSKTLARNHQVFLRAVNGIAGNKNTMLLKELKEVLQHGISDLLARMGNYVFEAPESVMIPFIHASSGKEKEHKYNFRKSLDYYFETLVKPQVKAELDKLEEVYGG